MNSLEGLRIPLDDGRSGRQRRRRNRMLCCFGCIVVAGAGAIFFKGLHSFQVLTQGLGPRPAPDTSRSAKEASRIAARHFPEEVAPTRLPPRRLFAGLCARPARHCLDAAAQRHAWAAALTKLLPRADAGAKGHGPHSRPLQ